MVEEQKKLSYEDARIITELVKQYFETINPALGSSLFRIESIVPNTRENIWIVHCSFKASFGSVKRLYYEVKVNSKTGEFGQVKKVKEDEE